MHVHVNNKGGAKCIHSNLKTSACKQSFPAGLHKVGMLFSLAFKADILWNEVIWETGKSDGNHW